MESYIARINQFETYLTPDDGQVICLDEFKDLCFGGIPDKPGLRQICWKILLGYLPLDKSRWDSVLMEQRRLYYSFVRDLIVEPELEEPPEGVGEEELTGGKGDSEWSLFLQDNKTLEQIDKDVRRTLPDFAFFQLPIPYSSLCPLSIAPKTREPKRKPTITISTEIGQTAVMPTISHSGSTGSLPGSGFAQRQRAINGSSMDLKWPSVTRTLTPTLKRRQTVTVMSPRACKKMDITGELDHWPSSLLSSSPIDSGTTTPSQSLSNGFRTPTNCYPSPIPSRLRDVAGTALAGVDDKDKGEEPSALTDYLFAPIPTRRSLFKRVAHLNQDFGSRQHQPHSLKASKSKGNLSKKQRNQNNSSKWDDASSDSSVTESDDGSIDELPQDLHWEAIERILFIYAKLNPGVGYVQGMNEILGPLYYLLANDPDEGSRAHAEAESFWLFHLLMAHFRDHFVRSLDRDRVSGIGSTIARMNFRLRQFDEHLWQNLEDKGIVPEYYSFRWLTVLCTQEFEVPDVWRIWDSVFADTGGVEKDYDFLLDFGCAMVCRFRNDLLEGDFADNVKLLQNYPSVDIQSILYLATVIRDQRAKGPPSKCNQSRRSSKPFAMLIKVKNGAPYRPNIGVTEQHRDSSLAEHVGGQDMKALTIDGIQNSDRLDYNLEGIDHRLHMYTPMPLFTDKDRAPGISGLSLEGLWLRSNNAGPISVSSSVLSSGQRPSPSDLSVDNFTMGRDTRPQTATWTEALTLFKARIVGMGSTAARPDDGTSPGSKTQMAIPGEAVGVLSPFM
ncbi:hypothetical protein EDD11_007060 [Mortierella claussenii]|nr:hypothetical protein EDD11_007060 [Mortierella claussenii]